MTKRFVPFLLLFLLTSLAEAAVSFTYTLDTKSSRTTSSTGSTTAISRTIRACAGRLTATNNSGTTPTLDAKIQYSPDGGTTWFDEIAFTQVTTGTSNQVVHVDTTVTRQYYQVRSVVTLAGTSPNYNFTVYLDCE